MTHKGKGVGPLELTPEVDAEEPSWLNGLELRPSFHLDLEGQGAQLLHSGTPKPKNPI